MRQSAFGGKKATYCISPTYDGVEAQALSRGQRTWAKSALSLAWASQHTRRWQRDAGQHLKGLHRWHLGEGSAILYTSRDMGRTYRMNLTPPPLRGSRTSACMAERPAMWTRGTGRSVHIRDDVYNLII